MRVFKEGIDVVRMSVNFNHIRVERGCEADLDRQTVVEYPMDLYIRGVNKLGAALTSVPFSLQGRSLPEVASFVVSGELLVEGGEDEVGGWISPVGREPPRVWSKIYQECVNVLAVLARIVEVPFPAPRVGGVTVEG